MNKNFNNLREEMTDEQKEKSHQMFLELCKQNPVNIYTKLCDESGIQYDKTQLQVVREFCDELVENTVDLDTNIGQIISDDFWEMHDSFEKS